MTSVLYMELWTSFSRIHDLPCVYIEYRLLKITVKWVLSPDKYQKVKFSEFSLISYTAAVCKKVSQPVFIVDCTTCLSSWLGVDLCQSRFFNEFEENVKKIDP